MTAPTWLAAGGPVRSTSGAAISITPPTAGSYSVGDLFVLTIVSDETSTLTAPTGWTSFSCSPQTSSSATTGNRLMVFWRRATSTSHTASDLNVSSVDAGNYTMGRMHVFTGVAGTGSDNPEDSAAGTHTGSTTGTSTDFPDLTTQSRETRIIFVCGHGFDFTTTTALFDGTRTWDSDITTVTKRSDDSINDSVGGGFALFEGTVTEISSLTGNNVAHGGGESTVRTSMSIALRAASTTTSSSDTGTSTESHSIQIIQSDTGSGTETNSISATLSGTDTGSGTETQSLATTRTDTATGTDSQSIAVTTSSSDTASVTETSQVSLTGTDTGSASETQSITVTLTATDTGTGTDSQSVDTGATPKSDSDSGTATETHSISVVLTHADTASGTETQLIDDGDLSYPPNLTVEPLSSSEMLISWDSVPEASYYQLERDSQIISSNITGTTYNDSGLAANTTYSYRVRSIRVIV